MTKQDTHIVQENVICSGAVSEGFVRMLQLRLFVPHCTLFVIFKAGISTATVYLNVNVKYNLRGFPAASQNSLKDQSLAPLLGSIKNRLKQRLAEKRKQNKTKKPPIDPFNTFSHNKNFDNIYFKVIVQRQTEQLPFCCILDPGTGVAYGDVITWNTANDHPC